MKVLIVGGGGREHALAWKISQSPRVKKIYCAPGNPGIATLAECVDIKADNIPALLDLVRQHKIDLTVVGPEVPLVAGLVDALTGEGYPVFGPSQKAAEIEGSKVLSKQIMAKYNIPTADFAVFDQARAAKDYVRQLGGLCVVKADGLAAGKGVIVAEDEATALEAIDYIMEQRAFGASGRRVVVEELLRGEEASLLAFTDGEHVLPMIAAQDHKQVFDQDKGPNTGGMGAYAPAPLVTPAIYEQALEQVLIPTVRGMAAEGRPYRGVLYAGLMIDGQDMKVLEYNARFGDPEAQPLMMMLESDVMDVMEATIHGELHKIKLNWHDGAAVCVVLAAHGYPGAVRLGDGITGLDQMPENVVAFHSGTKGRGGNYATAGGRVVGITARGSSIADAIDLAYGGAAKVSFDGMHFRRDIGQKALQR